MSLVTIRSLLEQRLNGITPAISYAWENSPFTPVNGIPYAKIFLLSSTPENPTLGDGFYRENGIFQVSLLYPLSVGSSTAATRAELIRTTFKRGTSMISGNITVRIPKTPKIAQGVVDTDRWHVPVSIPFFVDIIS